MPKKMQWVRLWSGYTVYYRQVGSGPPVLLVHGWGGSSRYWRDTITHLSAIRTVYALDLPGYGQSPPMTIEAATPERLARLVVEFANAKQLETFDLVGHSLGANVASYIAAGWPERVNKLVLACVGTYRNNSERRVIKIVHRLLSVWLRLRQPWMMRVPFLNQRIARNFFYRLPEDDRLLRECVYDFLRMNRKAAKESAVGMVGHTVRTVLQKITAPTLVIGASNDRLQPKYGPPAVSRLIPESQLQWIGECGHLPMVEQPDEFQRLLREFLLEERPIAQPTAASPSESVLGEAWGNA
jgi:pimeloyl-ACP methyl ester carboxylesterase